MFFQQIKILFLSIVTIFRRALCCFSKRRTLSFSEPIEALQSVDVIVADNYPAVQRVKQPAERDWNSWDDRPRTVEEHIEQYRQRLVKPITPPKEEPEPDFFKEITPDIKPQEKFYLGGNESANVKTDFSRLQVKTDVPITMNADLEDWIDEDQGGWEELDAKQTKQLIRDKQREIRSQRHKLQKPVGIEADPHTLQATRLSATHNPYST